MCAASSNPNNPGVSVIRTAHLRSFVDFLEKSAGPADGCLGRAGVSRELIMHTEGLVAFQRALRFVELASDRIGTQHMGSYVGRENPISRLGSYGQRLDACVTVHDYLHTGVSSYPKVSNAISLRLEKVRDGVRLHHGSGFSPSLGTHQSDLNFIEITVGKLREALGPFWAPRRVGLAYIPSEPVPADSLLASAGAPNKSRTAFIEIGSAELGALFPISRGPNDNRSHGTNLSSLPTDFIGLARLQIETLLPIESIGIELLAQSLGVSVRSLQRRIASAGSSFSGLLEDVRFQLATSWLEDTPKSIAEIAFDLGYNYPANFTRAFRRRTGVPPNVYREAVSAAG
jgi:AraC-like DNA-binding protein